MDKDHHLDAPDNESLQNIEQLTDRSSLTAIYPHAHDAWEGSNLMSRDEREQKRDKDQLRISITIRRWFAVIGVLVPLPFVLAAIGIALGSRFLSVDKLGILLLPVVIAVFIVLYISYRSIKFVYEIFYNHAIKATPFVITLIILLALSVYGVLLASQWLHNGDIIHDVAIISISTILMSIMYSGVLLLIWASQSLSSAGKMGCVALLVVAIGAATAFQIFF